MTLGLAPLLAVGAGRAEPPSRTPPPAEPSGSAVAGPTTGTSPAPTAGAGFSVGLEYGVPGLAAASEVPGVARAKPALEFGVWGNIEPRRGERDWGPLDALVAEYQAAGATDLQLIISADSPWAARAAKTDPMPQDRYLADYADFVRAFVERYDGDGVDDAPGLLAPVHEFGIEREFSGFWPGSAADYLRLLRLATPAIHAADPGATVLLVGLLAVDVFDGGPSQDVAEERWQADEPFRHARADVVSILSACDAYDAVDVHSLGDAVELPPTLDWIRSRLAEAGCPDRPIWIGDAFPMSPLVAYNQRPFYPAVSGDRAAINGWLGAVADPGDGNHDAAMAWLEREMAIGMSRKLTLAALAGASGINIGNLEDWSTGIAPADRLLVLGVGTAVFGGIQDRTVTLRSPGGSLPYDGQFFSRLREPGEARPALDALKVVAPILDHVTSATREDAGDPAVWLVKVVCDRGPAWIAWLDDGRLHLPGDVDPPEVTISIDTGRTGSWVTTIPTRRDAAIDSVPASGDQGRVTVRVGRVPVIVWQP